MEKFGILSRHAVIGFIDGCAVKSKAVHCGYVLIQGIEDALQIFLRVGLFELNESAQQEGAGGGIQDDDEPKACEGNDQQGFSANRHQKGPSQYSAPDHNSCPDAPLVSPRNHVPILQARFFH